MTYYHLFIRFLKCNNALSKFKTEIYNNKEKMREYQYDLYHPTVTADSLIDLIIDFDNTIYGHNFWIEMDIKWIKLVDEIDFKSNIHIVYVNASKEIKLPLKTINEILMKYS